MFLVFDESMQLPIQWRSLTKADEIDVTSPTSPVFFLCLKGIETGRIEICDAIILNEISKLTLEIRSVIAQASSC